MPNRKGPQEKLRTSEIRYRRLFETARDGILILDCHTRKITEANPFMVELLGYSREELVGRELWEIGLLTDKETSKAAFRHLQEQGYIRYEDLPLSTKQGGHREVEFVSNVYEEDGHQVIQCNIRDITERKQAEEILRESEERLRAIFHQSPVGMTLVRLDSQFLQVNQKLCDILGCSREELTGRTILEITHPDDHAKYLEVLRALFAGEMADLSVENRLLRKDLTPVLVGVTVTLLKDAAGQPQRMIAFIQDITERKKNEEERQQLLAKERAARAEAERVNRLKDEFLATVSHELRTPLNAILGWSSLLRGRRLDDANSARALETIERNAKAQAQLIEDILDVSRVIAGKLRLEARPLELISIINTAVDSVRLAADAKAIRIQTQLDPDAGLVSGDPNRLQQVFWNLLSNAIKFTPDGGRVKVGLERVNSDARITVSDTGKGIRAEFLPYVFDRFRQADSTTTRKHSGLGLGLAIVRHIVEMHGGTVHAESHGEAEGSVCAVRIPLMALGTRENSTVSERQRKCATHAKVKGFDCPPEVLGLRILAVDDEPDTLEMLRAVLERCGGDVRTSASVASALDVLQQWHPDVLVSDIAMPDQDGYALIAQVRALEQQRGGHIPSVALTAYVRVEDRTRVLKEGYDMFVPKPVEPGELLATLASLVRRIE